MKINRIFKSFLHSILTLIIMAVICSVSIEFCSHVNLSHFLWKQSYISGTKNQGQASRNLKEIAKIDHVKKIPTPQKVNSKIKTLGSSIHEYGLLDSLGLFRPSRMYVLHFTYHSQLYPLYAPDACEASSLRMALSTKGLAKHISMKKFINRIPRSNDPHKGYTSNPYYYGDSASIDPDALARYARKYYHAKVKDISGGSKRTFIREIEHGNPIVFEGAYQMKNSTSDHTLVIIGYRSGKPGQFLVADPFAWQNHGNKVFWTSSTNFMSIYKSSLRKEHALVIK